MGEVIMIGLEIAKSVFQVHGVDDAGAVMIRKRIGRSKVLEFFAKQPPCLLARNRSSASWPTAFGACHSAISVHLRPGSWLQRLPISALLAPVTHGDPRLLNE